MSALEDVAHRSYEPYLLPAHIMHSDWVGQLELNTVTQLASADLSKTNKRLRILILYGSLTRRYDMNASYL